MLPTIALTLSISLAAPFALAQGTAPGEPDAVEQRIDRLERSAREFAPAKPSTSGEVQVGGPGAEQVAGVASDPLAEGAGALREGAAVIDMRGRVAHTPAGWVFAADPANGNGSRAGRVVFRLLPSPTAERLRAVVEDRAATGEAAATFRVSGRVLVDRGRVYLLPVFATVIDPDQQEREPDEEEDAPTDVDPGVSDPDDPSVRELIERVERASEADRGGVRERFAGAAEGDSPGVRLLAGRVARLGRDGAGRLLLIFEAGAPGASGSTNDDALSRVAVLPCRLYGALEQVWASRGDGARLLVSGEAFRDQGRWFILPSLVEVERGSPSGLRTLR